MRSGGIFGGLMNNIKEILGIIVLCGFVLALLAMFNNDVGGLLKWLLDSIMQAIITVRDFFLRFIGG